MVEDNRIYKQEYEQDDLAEPEGLAGDELEEPLELENAENPEEETQVPTPTRIPIPVSPTIEKATDAAGNVLWGEPKPEPPKNELDDMFAVPEPEDNDMYTDDLFEVEEEDVDLEDDLSDLTSVTDEDIMGAPPKPRPPVMRYRRTSKRYNPPTSMGGIR